MVRVGMKTSPDVEFGVLKGPGLGMEPNPNPPEVIDKTPVDKPEESPFKK
jgi:hypothetical protein